MCFSDSRRRSGEKTVDIGNCSETEVDKFSKFHLTQAPAKDVSPPLIVECLANIECRVHDKSLVSKYELFTLEAVRAHVNPDHKEQRTFHHCGDGTFSVDGRIINLQERMVKWRAFQD